MKKVTVTDIEPLVTEYNGNIAAIARRLGVSRGTIHNRINESPTLRTAIDDAHEALVDNVESALYREVLNGNVTAMIFWLKTQGKRRGWVERTEIAGVDGGPMVINMTWGDVDDGNA